MCQRFHLEDEYEINDMMSAISVQTYTSTTNSSKL